MKIVNKHTHHSTPNDIYCGRGSLLGNPYRIGIDGSRLHVIKKYAVWLWMKIMLNDPEVMGILAAMHEGTVLL